MVQLYLSIPESDICGNNDVVKERISLLQRLESILWSLITSGGRYEARLWFCNTISCIHTIHPRDQCDLFIDLLKSKSSKKDVSEQILRLVIEKRPEKVGPIIAKKSYMLEKFFGGNSGRILQWFDNFASTSESGHKKGARAIAQYAFVNRDICWEELEWKGKHGQSPAVVATKPHYFHDLDVLRTVENFLEYVPEFWSSDELAESVKDGDILNLDVKYFVDQFIQLMYKDNLEDIWVVIESFLMEADFSFLCQHLLILLDERDLLTFLKSLGRQLLRLLGEEEHGEEKEHIEELLRNAEAFNDTAHWAFMKESVNMKVQEAIKWMGLQAWIIHYYLSRECITRQSCESVFVRNGICFRKSDEYSLLRADGFAKGHSSNSDGEDVAQKGGHKRRKRDKKKKRRKKHDREENYADELAEFETFDGRQGLQCGASSWFLSTDGYSFAWNIADLPDHLSRHCFLTWMKWMSSN